MPPLNISKQDSLKLGSMDEGGLPSNMSQQELLPNAVVEYNNGSSVLGPNEITAGSGSQMTKRQVITVVVLCYVNLINYMDRYTIAGILDDIKRTYDLTDSQSGLLQTAFIVVYMFMAPLYGFLGDRYNRKYLLATGIFIWGLTTLVGSFMPTYGLFLMCRCLVGVGEASYSTIAPTIISDLFVSDLRSKMLAFFYFAIPVGSGLGYMVGALVTNLIELGYTEEELATSEAWRWGLRVTPIMGAIALILILFVLQEPPRGHSEGGEHLKPTSFWSDLKYLFFHKSFVFSTIAFTLVTYVAGALAWWGPQFVERGAEVQVDPNVNPNSISFVIGVTAMISGLVGVPLGSYAGRKLRVRYPFADAVVCAVGLIISFPLLILGAFLTEYNTIACYVVFTFGQIFLNLNWAVVSDIVLYVVIPTRRSSAEAFQILTSHALGDAISPYIVGVVADAIKPHIHTDFINTTTAAPFTTPGIIPGNHTYFEIDYSDPEAYAEFKSLQYSLLITCLFEIFGAIFFFWTASFIQKDKEACTLAIARSADDGENDIRNDIPQPTHCFADDIDPELSRQLLT